MTAIFCPRCQRDVDALVEDTSFDHEFGKYVQWDVHCPECNSKLPLPVPKLVDPDV